MTVIRVDHILGGIIHLDNQENPVCEAVYVRVVGMSVYVCWLYMCLSVCRSVCEYICMSVCLCV
jgi:hypothetical protein